MKRFDFAFLIFNFSSILVGCTAPEYTRYVDPYIGTGGHGHVFLGAHVPHGMVQLGPTQATQGWDWCSGYNYADTTIVGFSHQHLSGTGIGDLGDVTILPVVGEVTLPGSDVNYAESSLLSTFSHEREEARPGYYRVLLDRYGIEAELTATTRVGLHRYRFPASSQARVVIDLARGIGWDTMSDTYLVQESPTRVSGYRFSTGWARDQRTFFAIEFSKPVEEFVVHGHADTTRTREGYFIGSPAAYGEARFAVAEGEQVLLKVGLSSVSRENARENLEAELPGWDFEATARQADRAWNEALGRIDFRTRDEAVRKVFYTAMYHYLTAPVVFQDVNGQYRGADGKTYGAEGFTIHSIFSLWDTYRAAHPLMTLIEPELSRDVAKTFLRIHDEQGKLPVWHLVGNETDCMVGNPGAIVLADLILKGYVEDEQRAFEAMKHSAMLDERGLNLYKAYGFIPYDLPDGREAVGRSMEYAIADRAIAEVARKLGKTEDEAYFAARSKAYRHFFDPNSGFMRGRSSKGGFIEPLEPTRSAHEGLSVYTEGNAWQYTFLVPHDVAGLVALFPSEERFVSKLDSLFVVQSDPDPQAPPDVTGLIGQYAHGNEPSHHIAYLYNYAGQPWKSARRLREIMTTYYTAAPDGLCGNEDVGQMSAWYLLSSMGLYQVEPAGGRYVFGSPIMDEAVLHLADGKRFTIVARDNSSENSYIQRVKLNGKPHTKSYITYDQIVRGGRLEFFMGSEPSDFGTAKEDRP